MTRYVPRVVVPLVVVCSTAVLATAAPAGTTDTNARLTLVDRAPLTFSGFGFPPSRSITLQVVTPNGSVRRVLTSNAGGRIRAAFTGVSLTGRLRCAVGVTVIARVTGGEAVLWAPKLPDCPSPLRPPASGAAA